jgi:hypothetical protein
MKWLSLAIATVFAGLSHAALRFGCSTLTIQRLDPLVQPGKTPSAHVHQIVGGNAFHPNMTGDIGNQGTCTTCTFTEDFSNYWTAVMYFRHTNGSYKRVPIMQNGALPTPINGGMTVYYTQQDFSSNGNVKMTAFRPVGTISLYPSETTTDRISGLPHDYWQPHGWHKAGARTQIRLLDQ